MSTHNDTAKQEDEQNTEVVEQNSPFYSDPNAKSKPQEEVHSDLGGLVDTQIASLEDGT